MEGGEAGDANIREVVVVRTTSGFGFNIKGTTQEGGVLQAIEGNLYPPLQYVSAVDPGGAAFQGGLRKHDRILGVNGQDVQGANHSAVVDLVIRGGDRLDLRILRISDGEALRLQRLEAAMEDKKRNPKGSAGSAAVEVRSHYNVATVATPFTVYNIYLSGEYQTSRRYSEFDKLNKQLKQRFRWFKFPPLPPKRMNGMFGGAMKLADIDDRRAGLCDYLAVVFAAEDILKSEAAEAFLALCEEQKPPGLFRGQTDPSARKRQPNAAPVKRAPARAVAAPPPQAAVHTTRLTATLPDDSIITIQAPDDMTVTQAELAIGTKAGLGEEAALLFGLFDGSTLEGQRLKLPGGSKAATHKDVELYYSKWVFTKMQEAFFDADEACVRLLYAEAVKGVSDGRISAGSNAMSRLASFEEKKDKLPYLRQARKLKTYAMFKSAPCGCDYPEEDSTTIVFADVNRIILQACADDGTPQPDEDALTEFGWDIVTRWKRKGDVIGFRYTTEGDDGNEEEETVTLTTPIAPLLETVFRRIQLERSWAEELQDGAASDGNFFQER